MRSGKTFGFIVRLSVIAFVALGFVSPADAQFTSENDRPSRPSTANDVPHPGSNSLTTANPVLGSTGGGHAAGICACPASSCAGGCDPLTQTCSTVDAETQIACSDPATGATTENKYARCFDMVGEGAAGDHTVTGVTFGVSQLDSPSGDTVPINVNLYLAAGCPPSVETSTLICSASTTVTAEDIGTLVTVPVHSGLVPAGSFLVIEIEAPLDGTLGTPGNDHAFRPAAVAGDDSCEDALLLAANCGLSDWTGVQLIGFPDSQTLIEATTIEGLVEPVCENGTCDCGEDCASCPQDCGACPVCGNGILESGEECDPVGFPNPQCTSQECLPGCICAPNVAVVGQWDGFEGSYADVWGDGQFAYLGHFGDSAVHIVDISDPSNPGPGVEYVLPPPNTNASAQDVKVANGLLFIGLEGNSEAGVHIVDVRDPPNPVGLVDIDISGFNFIHNVFYDNGFLYLADSGSTRVGIVDLTTFDPDNPPAEPITSAKWIVESIGDSFVHDMTVKDGRMYACAWDSGLWIYDVTNVANEPPSFLGSTPDGGNNTHSAWPSDDGQFVVTGEERTGGGIKVYRITDLGGSLELELSDAFAMPTSEAFSVHNQFFVGNRLYNAWYGAGLQVFDINTDTGLLELVASYDTTEGGGSGGLWGVYPLLGSDKVLASDRGQGLFIFNVDPDPGPNADLDGDGDVDAADLAELISAWGPTEPCPPFNPADLDEDCDVDAADLAELISNWG